MGAAVSLDPPTAILAQARAKYHTVPCLSLERSQHKVKKQGVWPWRMMESQMPLTKRRKEMRR